MTMITTAINIESALNLFLADIKVTLSEEESRSIFFKLRPYITKNELTIKTKVDKNTNIVLYILSVRVIFMFCQNMSEGSGAL